MRMLFICIIYWLFEFYNCESYIKENNFGEYVFYYMGISFYFIIWVLVFYESLLLIILGFLKKNL